MNDISTNSHLLFNRMQKLDSSIGNSVWFNDYQGRANKFWINGNVYV